MRIFITASLKMPPPEDTILALAEQYKKIKKDVVFSEKILALS